MHSSSVIGMVWAATSVNIIDTMINEYSLFIGFNGYVHIFIELLATTMPQLKTPVIKCITIFKYLKNVNIIYTNVIYVDKIAPKVRKWCTFEAQHLLI